MFSHTDLAGAPDLLTITEVHALLAADLDRIHEVSFTDAGYAVRLLADHLTDLCGTLRSHVP
ncbi:MAG TPA: hypothetical protein DHV14_01985 [Micrococcales bacterium]|uniref:hypothetical protein n=1 Tax=Miniimonas arenae TaxID=676201 RepID=UPI000EC3D9A1|nr:hypothetical protein [Miniimonas arenae]HCX83909.1 hypothetical protein [Micrococcales bacterium]